MIGRRLRITCESLAYTVGPALGQPVPEAYNSLDILVLEFGPGAKVSGLGHLFFKFLLISFNLPYWDSEAASDLYPSKLPLLYEAVDGADRDGKIIRHLIHPEVLLKRPWFHICSGIKKFR